MIMRLEQWLTEGRMDAEWKRYRLLARLQEADDDFDKEKLFPQLTLLEQDLALLQSFSHAYRNLEEQTPKTLYRFDFKNARTLYQNMPLPVSAEMEHCKEMANYAIPLIQTCVEKGRTLFQHTTQQLQLNRVGLFPLDINSGYLFLQQSSSNLILVYTYLSIKICAIPQGLHYLHVRFICTYRISMMNTI